MWIGSSVIHLGDTNVPNAVVFIGALAAPNVVHWSLGSGARLCLASQPSPFLPPHPPADKYTQVARILGPIVQTLKHIPKLAEVRLLFLPLHVSLFSPVPCQRCFA